MYKKSLLSAAIASTLLTGCLDSENLDSNNASDGSAIPEVTSTYAVFNPAISLLPVPSDVLVETDDDGNGLDGTYSASSSLAALDFLDGASTTAPINVPFSGPLSDTDLDGRAFIDHPDAASNTLPLATPKTLLIPNPNQNVFLLDITYPGGDELSSVEVGDVSEVPTLEAAVLYQTYATAFGTIAAVLGAMGTPTQDQIDALDAAEEALLANTNFRVELVTLDGYEGSIRIMPREPLKEESKYLVVLTNEITDSDGDNVTASPVYDDLTNSPRSEFEGNSTYLGLYDAIDSWETLATGYFNALLNNSLDGSSPSMRAAFGKESLDASNVVLSYTFTTGGTDAVLNAMAAPETFFIKKATIDAQQAGITKLLSGEIALNASEISAGNIATNDTCLNSLFLGTVTDSSSAAYIKELDATNADYDDTLLYFSDLTSSTDIFKAESAAAGAQLAIANDDGTLAAAFAANGCDIAEVNDSTTISATAVGQVATINGLIPGALSRPASGLSDKENTIVATADEINTFDTFLPIGVNPLNPAEYADFTKYALPSSAVNPAFTSPGLIMQGQIDVPYFLPDASATGNPTELITGTWDANTAATAAGVAPPTDKVTYRFPLAEQLGTETIPFLLSVPDEDNDGIAEPPAGGYPVVIYQHGIFGSRGHSLPIGNGLGAGCLSGGANPTNAEVANPAGQDAPRCFATIAIDMPLHGVAPTNAPGTTPDAFAQGGLSVDVDSIANLYAARDWSSTHYAGLRERHFGFSKAADGTPTPMVYDNTDTAMVTNSVGYPGEFYINLAQPAGSRDNLRQSVMDLLTLNASLADIDVNGDGVGDLNTDRVYFIGHSLGGIVGTTFVATNNNAQVQAYTTDLPDLKAVSLQTTGGQITRILENSPALGGTILAGLRAAGVAQGTNSFETFMNTSQAAITSADSINFASKVADLGIPVLATEIYGDGTDRDTQDDTIANGIDSVDGTYFDPAIDSGTGTKALNSPLAGTEPLFAELELDSLTAGFTEDNVDGITGAVRFNSGEHITIITGDPANIIGEMGAQLVTFFSSQGQEVAVGTVDAASISTADPDISN